VTSPSYEAPGDVLVGCDAVYTRSQIPTLKMETARRHNQNNVVILTAVRTSNLTYEAADYEILHFL
jgi:hypothetical protein